MTTTATIERPTEELVLARRLRIEVTAQDLATGLRNSEFLGPIAHAVRRKFLPFLEVSVTGSHDPEGPKIWVLVPDGCEVTYRAGRQIGEWMSAFDAGEVVHPFCFEAQLTTAGGLRLVDSL
jgi:hypothetical protein